VSSISRDGMASAVLLSMKRLPISRRKNFKVCHPG
jgi:hypothetical protein